MALVLLLACEEEKPGQSPDSGAPRMDAGRDAGWTRLRCAWTPRATRPSTRLERAAPRLVKISVEHAGTKAALAERAPRRELADLEVEEIS